MRRSSNIPFAKRRLRAIELELSEPRRAGLSAFILILFLFLDLPSPPSLTRLHYRSASLCLRHQLDHPLCPLASSPLSSFVKEHRRLGMGTTRHSHHAIIYLVALGFECSELNPGPVVYHNISGSTKIEARHTLETPYFIKKFFLSHFLRLSGSDGEDRFEINLHSDYFELSAARSLILRHASSSGPSQTRRLRPRAPPAATEKPGGAIDLLRARLSRDLQLFRVLLALPHLRRRRRFTRGAKALAGDLRDR